MLTWVIALTLVAVPGLQAAVETGADPFGEPRLGICLNGDWLRHVGDDVDTLPADGWETVRVPEYAHNAATGSAWFRLDFQIPAALVGEGKRILLRFIRVRHYAKVFLNGKPCGENYGARAPFEVDVTDAARPGELNRVEVWVHHCGGAYAMPGKVVEDLETLKRLSTLEGYREQATIAEDVFLISRPQLHVSAVLVIPSVRQKRLDVRLTVTNDSVQAQDVTLNNAVLLEADEVLGIPSRQLELLPGQSQTVTIGTPWDEPRLWGYPPYGEPILYHLQTRLEDADGRQVDRLVTRFGFREIWTEPDRITFNGRELRVLGYWVPEGSGRTVWSLRMAAVQSAGCNAIHNHAEQREPAFYDVADEMGLLVWDANYCGGPLGTTGNLTDAPFPDVVAELERQYPLWAKAVANHPSVVILMMECLFNQEAAVRLGQTYRQADPTRLIHRGGGMVRPMDLAAYASNFAMDEEAPLSNIRSSYESRAKNLTTFEGHSVLLVNKEIWYKIDWQNPPTSEAIAEATTNAIDYLNEKGLPGFILYSQQAFRNRAPAVAPITWPSRSGEGQHPDDTRTGGHPWQMREFVNFRDHGSPAFHPTPTAGAMREAGGRYLGHQVPSAPTRRPEVLVTVTRDGRPVPDAYVYAVPVAGSVSAPSGMRTDGQGTAWFALRDPGTYRFTCWTGTDWGSVRLDAPLQPLDVGKGGVGPLLRVDLAL